jgi:hypothetical protein
VPKRQQLVLERERELRLVLEQVLELLLFCRKQPEQQLQRSLPKRVTCSFFDSLMNVRNNFPGMASQRRLNHCSGRRFGARPAQPGSISVLTHACEATFYEKCRNLLE